MNPFAFRLILTDNSKIIDYSYSTAGLFLALILELGAHGLVLIRSLGRRGVYVEAVESDLNQFHRYSKYSV